MITPVRISIKKSKPREVKVFEVQTFVPTTKKKTVVTFDIRLNQLDQRLLSPEETAKNVIKYPVPVENGYR